MGKAKGGIDRRMPRTRAMLQKALMSLILKKDYEAITVQDICDAADVGRSTFYAHYSSKDDLKRSGFEHLRKDLAARQKCALATPGDIRNRSLSFSLTMFEHARDHVELHRALTNGHAGAIALCSIRQMLSDLARDGGSTQLRPGSNIPARTGCPRFRRHRRPDSRRAGAGAAATRQSPTGRTRPCGPVRRLAKHAPRSASLTRDRGPDHAAQGSLGRRLRQRHQR